MLDVKATLVQVAVVICIEILSNMLLEEPIGFMSSGYCGYVSTVLSELLVQCICMKMMKHLAFCLTRAVQLDLEPS